MTIIFCTNTFSTVGNGPSKFAHLLLDVNRREGIDLYVLTEDCPEDKKIPNVIKVRVGKKGMLGRKMGMLARNFDYYKGILRFIAQSGKKPDIVIFNNAIVGIYAAKKLRIPVVGMINDALSVHAKWGISKKHIRHKTFQFFERVTVRACALTLTNSDYLTGEVLRGYNANPDKVARLYKGVDVETCEMENRRMDKGNPTVLFVKSNWKNGGLVPLVKALNLLAYNFKLRIIGPSKDELTYPLSLASGNIKVEVLGKLTQSEVFDEMRKADIFCTPSYSEALGVANMEAILNGLPVVYADVGGVPEVMDYGKNGFACTPGNPKSIAAALAECLRNDVEREKKKAAGKAFVAEHFGKRRMLDSFVEICYGVA